MNQNVQAHTSARETNTNATKAGSAFLVALGIFFLPIDLWMKGYLTMGVVMLVQTCVTLTKTVRDNHESSRLMNRIEDAKAERRRGGGAGAAGGGRRGRAGGEQRN